MKVLIGYDGSRCADDAITDLQRAGLAREGTEAMVLSVWDAFVSPGEGDGDALIAGPTDTVVLRDVQRLRAAAREAMTRTRETAERGAARVRELFPGWSVHADAKADAPHWALVGAAAESKTDLVVVGSHGRSALGRLVLGSASQLVLQHAPCSVRIARCATGQVQPRVRLVLGIDGSVDSAAAATAVAARHWPAGTEVLVLGVFDSRAVFNYLEANAPGVSGESSNAYDAAASSLADALERVCDELRHAGLTADASLLTGDPKKLFLQEAERLGADCIFIGARGHTRLQRLLLGSVSASVAARAHCSVEVVRHGY